MSEGIPKSARDLLSRQTAADAHPSADLLNAYVEHALTAEETSRVLSHLSCCDECREIVFVASAAMEDEPAVALIAAAPTPQATSARRASATPAMMPAQAKAEGEKARRIWWKWAAPIAAVVLVAAAAFLNRDRLPGHLAPPNREMAEVKQQPVAPPPAETDVGPEAPIPQLDGKTAARLPANKTTPNSESEYRAAGNLPAQPTPTVKKDQASHQNVEQPAPALASSGAQMAGSLRAPKSALVAQESQAQSSVTAAAPPPVSADTAPNTIAAAIAKHPQGLFKSQFAANKAAENGAESTAPAQAAQRVLEKRAYWRINPNGQLEHALTPGDWKRVLASEPVNFRAVTIVDGNVWAGGDGGALFHSSDGGEHWNKVALGETAAITTIHFDTAQQGSLTTEAGAVWTTTDGGHTWSRQ